MIYDVAVVGAGPAGSYLSYLLARDGYRVALLDKKNFPRDKVCGGGISNKTIKLLDFDIAPVVERNIRGAYLSFQNRQTVIRDLQGESGVTVTRRQFDELLLRRAVSHGARFFPSSSFLGLSTRGRTNLVEASGRTIRARTLVGADGVFSQVRARVLGTTPVRYAPALEALVYVDPEVIDRFDDRILLDFGGMRRGYGWIFPKRDHLNVGVFSIYGSKNLRTDLQAFMQRYDSLRRYRRIEYKGSAIPVHSAGNRAEEGSVLLVGDAAGFAESFYGEGIYFALKSAVLAHEAITASGDGPSPGFYTRRLRKVLGPDLAYSRLNARLFFRRQRFGFDRMVRSVRVNDRFAGLIGGRVGHRECFWKTLATLPHWLMSERYAAVPQHL